MNVLNFGSQFGNPDVAGAYFVCVLTLCLGAFQIIAARYGYIGLAWLRPRWQPAGGIALGATLIVSGSALFFSRQASGIFRPGPAGLELFLLFGAGLALALPLTLAGAALVQASAARRALPRGGAVLVEAVGLPSGVGWLYRPAGEARLRPAVCAIGTPGAGPEAVARLATALAEAGVMALAVGWNETHQWRPDEIETLTTAISAASFLRELHEVDANRLGTVGVGLGGDVALQIAAVDNRFRAVVAVAPWLDLVNAEPGLSLLRDMTLPQAWRWQRALRQTARQLDPLAHARHLHPRPVLLVQPDDLGPSEGARRALAHLCRHLTTLPVPYLGQSRDASRQIANWMSAQLAV